MLIGRSEIAGMIPHAGAMCLLDGVLRWDAASIYCVSASHKDRRNPLSSRGRLHAICGIEYAAQVMAVHGRLTGAAVRRPQAGYLASVRDLVCHVACLDTLEGDLVIYAEKLLGDELRVVYQFKLSSDDVEIMSGRAAAVMDAGSI